MNPKELARKTVGELRELAQKENITGISKKTKKELVEMLSERLSQTADNHSDEATKSKDISVEDKKEESTEQPVSEKAKVEEGSSEPAAKPVLAPVPVPSIPLARPKAPVVATPQSEAQPTQQAQSENTTPQPQQNHHQKERHEQKPRFNNDSTVEVSGILEIMSDGTHGVLRSSKLIPSEKDTYISISQVKKFRLRKGDFVTGTARLPKENERYFSLLWIKDVNGLTVDKLGDRPNFDDLKPVYPDKQIKLEIGQYPISNRVIDLLAPVGFGQRGMIVAQPKSGKTFLIKDIAKGINQNYPEVELFVVLIGERPEEVTDIERSVNGTVYASNFDESPQNQVAVAELSLERAKRLVEMGKDVIILMDSLTRLARAYNVALPASGRTLSGGLDPVSLYPSKRFFGAARNFEVGASLTIIATSLVDTGSKMDEVIFEEFKGTGNMELHLNRDLANKRVFPAIDVVSSGTRNEELLLGSESMQNSWKIRRLLDNLGREANEALIDRMKTTKSNEDFVNTMHQY